MMPPPLGLTAVLLPFRYDKRDACNNIWCYETLVDRRQVEAGRTKRRKLQFKKRVIPHTVKIPIRKKTIASLAPKMIDI